MTKTDEAFFSALIEWIKQTKPSKEEIHKYKITLCHTYGRRDVPTDIEIYMNTSAADLETIRPFVQSKPTRTASGVAIIATMTAPALCPHGACIFCPGGLGSYFGDTPMSYTGTEPSTMRGRRNDWDPYRIIFNRLQQYLILGQFPDKCEHIIQGGTFPAYDEKYREQYIRDIFAAYNDFSDTFFDKVSGELKLDYFKEFFELPCKPGEMARTNRVKDRILAIKSMRQSTIEEEHLRNETAIIRCIGLTIETKPDWGLAQHGLTFLRYGATRVELGVQTLYEEILQATNRGHTLQDTADSFAQLKDLAFKINAHMMPGLPTPNGHRIEREKDLSSIQSLFTDTRFRPDMIKIYPCMVMPGTPLEKFWKEGIFVPLSSTEAADIIAESMHVIPEYCRIMRIQRDIPVGSTTAGVTNTNLRQLVEKVMQERHIVAKDIRAREPRVNAPTTQAGHIVVEEFTASGGREFFISMVSGPVLMGFVRLRYPGTATLHPSITADSALIRELHVYGQAVPIGAQDHEKVQHRGIGRQLMARAEEIAREHGKKKMLVISGVGVREYYRKLGYERDGMYMGKTL